MEKWKIVAEEHEGSLFYMQFCSDAFNKGIKKIIGVNQNNGVFEFKGDTWVYACPIKEWFNAGEKVLEIILKKPNFIKNLRKIVLKNCENLDFFISQLKREDISKKSDKELSKIIGRYYKLHQGVLNHGIIPVLLDFEVPHLSSVLGSYLDEMAPGKKDITSEYFATLTTPLDDSFQKKEEKEQFELSLRLSKNKEAVKLFKKDLETIKKDIQKYKEYGFIKKYAEKWSWVGHGYQGCDWDLDYFLSGISEKIKNGKIKDKINALYKEKISLIKKQEGIRRLIEIDKLHARLFEDAQTIGFIKAYRKDIMFKSYSAIDPLLIETAKRFGITLKQVRSMTAEEIAYALDKGKLDKKLLEERAKYCAHVTGDKPEKTLVGKEAEEFMKRVQRPIVDYGINEIKGTCACKGYAKGIVKIILKTEDMAKFNQGDIMISPATNPNVVPAMKKAAAIVTDQGGITCHAAIVSREMNIPCVIGTKIATKVFKDGDHIEVDANKGIVKKLK